jgi:tetratricopeptide (TPR) repeat protein
LYSGFVADILMRGEVALTGAIFRVSVGFLVVALMLLAVSLYLSVYYLEERQPRLAAAGDTEGALQAAQTAARLDPFDPEPLRSQSSLLQREGRDEEAARVLEAAIERGPHDYLTYHLLANIQMTTLDNIDAAVENYRRAVELNPIDSALRASLAQALMIKGDLEAAREEYEKLEENHRISYEGLYDLGRIYVRTGEPAEGATYIRRAKARAAADVKRLEGPLRDAREDLIQSMDLALADAYVVQGRYSAARKILEESPEPQAPALLALLNTDPEEYRESVVNSDIY